jgi:hypothetical protein
MYKFITTASAIFIYNLIMAVSILLIAAYWLYHHQPPIDDHIAWTAPASQAQFIRRQGKINRGEI